MLQENYAFCLQLTPKGFLTIFLSNGQLFKGIPCVLICIGREACHILGYYDNNGGSMCGAVFSIHIYLSISFARSLVSLMMSVNAHLAMGEVIIRRAHVTSDFF